MGIVTCGGDYDFLFLWGLCGDYDLLPFFFLSLSPETEYGRGGPLIQCVFSVPAIVRNCGLSLGSGGQVSRKRGEQDVLIELGKLGVL